MDTNRQPVHPQDIEVGCILFPPRTSYTENLKCMWVDVSGHPCQEHGDCVLMREGHGHPVVIIGKHYGLDENNPDGLMLSFVQMTHESPELSTSGNTVHSAYGHYGRIRATGRLTFPQNFRSRYWLRGLESLQRGPGNFRIPHVFYTEHSDLKTMTNGLEAKAYDSRLDEGSYLRLMQRLNLEPKPYVPDNYWENPGPAASGRGSSDQEQTTFNHDHDLNRAPSGQSSNQPRGHHIAGDGNLRYPIQFDPVVPTLDPAPTGRRRDTSTLSLPPIQPRSEHDGHLDDFWNKIAMRWMD